MDIQLKRGSSLIVSWVLSYVAVFFGLGNLLDWDFSNMWLFSSLILVSIVWLYTLIWSLNKPLIELCGGTIIIRRTPFAPAQKIPAMDVRRILYSNKWKTPTIIIEYKGFWPAKIPVGVFLRREESVEKIVKALNDRVAALKAEAKLK